MLRTTRKCTWEEIEIGEVFAGDGCWNIGYKTSKDDYIFLATDFHAFNGLGESKDDPTRWNWFCAFGKGLYKLPKAVQQLWKTEEE